MKRKSLNSIINKHQKEINYILEILDKYGYFEEMDDGSSFEDDVYYDFNKYSNIKATWNNGASKGVLIFKDLGFVIKIPFIYCDGYELTGAYEGNLPWDYCSQEQNRYLKMKNECHVEKVFLETRLIGHANGHPIYIQPYAEPLSSIGDASHSSHSKMDVDEIERMRKMEDFDYPWIDTEWEADLLALYGKDFYLKFLQSIKDYRISGDLRDDNIGYVGKYPIILDYAGFDD